MQALGVRQARLHDESVVGGRVHEFCCKSHADEAIARGEHQPSQRARQQHNDVYDRFALPG